MPSRTPMTMVFNKSTNYDFILPSMTYQGYLETRAANIWDLVESDQSTFQ